MIHPMTDEPLTTVPVPTTPRDHVHLVVGRQHEQGITEFALGTIIDPRLVLVPLALSGPLRPRAGVVVMVPDRFPVPVTQVFRTEDKYGQALGLLLDRPLVGLPLERLPADGLLDEWLTQCDDVGAWSPGSSPAETDLPRGYSDIICKMFPKWRGC